MFLPAEGELKSQRGGFASFDTNRLLTEELCQFRLLCSYLKVEDGVGGVGQLGQVVGVVAHLRVVVVERTNLKQVFLDLNFLF